jgi:amino acid adenylation domain-containing protein
VDVQLSAAWDIDDPAGRLPVHLAVARWAAQTPDAPAISCAGSTLSYRELDDRANRMANFLRSLGIGRDVVVAIHLPRGFDHYIALLGVLKAGGAALPLDTTYPEARLRYMLGDSGAKVVLTRHGLPDIESASDATVVRVDTDADAIAAHPPTAPPDETGPSDLAYVMYTSASTGPPKGVQLEHGGISNLCRWHIAALRLTSADCGSLAAPLSFDASIVDLWPLLVAGARTVAIDDETRSDLPGMVLALGEHRVTVCFLTTALAELLLAQPGLEELALRYLVTGGEALRRRPRPGLPFKLINVYGPTETTVYATSIVVDEVGTGSIPIGYAVGGAVIRLLDKQGRQVPDGEPGEVVIAGAGVGRGYLGKPELTTERFRPDPVGRRYHTGDLARLREDGSYEFLGRIDRQVKVRGHRIELDEIERALLEHPAVLQAAVAVVRPTEDSAQLVAYVEPRLGWTPEHIVYDAPSIVYDVPRGVDDAETKAVIRAVEPDSVVNTDHGDLDSLLQDVTEAIHLTPDGGTILVPGLRSLPLLTSAYASETSEFPPEERRWRVRGKLLADAELAVHPAAFARFARINRVAAVHLRPRPTQGPRYDVVLRVGPALPTPMVTWLDWERDGLDLAGIRQRLRAGQPPVLGVRGIAASVVDLLALSIGVPYQTLLSVAAGRADGSVDAVWCHESVPDAVDIRWPGPDSEHAALANDPRLPERNAALRDALREALATRFVAHEMPDLFVVLDQLPLTPVGKVDRNALPPPHWLTGSASDDLRTTAEVVVAGLVSEVLGRASVGRLDDLKALGAHSLTMTQVAARIASRFGVTVPIRALLAEPTVEAIAIKVEQAIAADLGSTGQAAVAA